MGNRRQELLEWKKLLSETSSAQSETPPNQGYSARVANFESLPADARSLSMKHCLLPVNICATNNNPNPMKRCLALYELLLQLIRNATTKAWLHQPHKHMFHIPGTQAFRVQAFRDPATLSACYQISQRTNLMTPTMP